MVIGRSFFELPGLVAQLGEATGHIAMAVAMPALTGVRKAQFEDEMAAGEALAAAGDQGFSILGLPWWGVLLFVLLILVVLGMLGMIRRSLKENQQAGDEELIENPLFEEQFAVHDDDVELTANLQSDLNDDAEEPARAERQSLFDAGTDEADGDETDYTDEEILVSETISEDEAYVGADESDDADALIEAESEEPESADEEAEGEPAYAAYDEEIEEEPDSENVIHLKDHAETADDAPADLEDDLAEEYEASEITDDEPAQEDEQVRYAFASAPKGPIAFSGISEEDSQSDHDAPAADTPVADDPAARPYIAPTVLREDMVKLERHQAERLDALRADFIGQVAAMRSEHNSRLDLIINSLDRKMENLAEASRQSQKETIEPLASATPELTRKIGTLQAALENQGQRIRAITQILDDRLGTVGHIYGEVRSVGERLENLGSKFEQLEKSIGERAQHDVIADVQLSDVVRSSLGPDQYEFKPLLSNNNRADCLIRLPHPPGAIVIDTKFPLDAFNALPPRDDVAQGIPQAKAAEDAFRRAVLRHIIDVAERFIIPGETADSALLFLPTESIYTTLHARFPDLVRDSFRARVWIVSPATLMGTLQTLRGVLRDAREFEEAQDMQRESREVMSEVETLRAQAAALAQNFENAQHELRSLVEATQKVTDRHPARPAPAGDRDTLMSQLYDNRPEWPGSAADEPSPQTPGKKSPPDDLR